MLEATVPRFDPAVIGILQGAWLIRPDWHRIAWQQDCAPRETASATDELDRHEHCPAIPAAHDIACR